MAVEPWIQRYDCKVICKFSTAQWSAPHIPRLFKDQLYMVPTTLYGSYKVQEEQWFQCPRMWQHVTIQLWLQPCCLCGLGQFLRSHKWGRQYMRSMIQKAHCIHPTSSFKKCFLPQRTLTMYAPSVQADPSATFFVYSGFSLKCFFWPRLAKCKNCLFTFLMEKRKLAEFTTALIKLFHCWSQEANSHLPQHEKYL